ncbi:MAG: elongation factor P [Candidatus Paceibacterota bacterium]
MKKSAGTLKRGNFIKLSGEVLQVLRTQRNFRVRGSANIKVRIRNVSSGAVQDKNFKADNSVELIDVETRPLQFLYKDTQTLHFMDSVSFEQYHVSAQIAGSFVKFLKEGEKIHIALHENKPLSIIPPKSVKLKVTQAHTAAKGDTATGAKKTVVVETGARVKVPLFIKKDETIVINPETGEYVERA